MGGEWATDWKEEVNEGFEKSLATYISPICEGANEPMRNDHHLDPVIST